jgi:hypothetical protein
MDYDGDSEWVELGKCDSLRELVVVRGLLESAGIQCSSPALDWTARIWKGTSDLAVLVRECDIAEARAILDTSGQDRIQASNSSSEES